jgi:hypothetical protein
MFEKSKSTPSKIIVVKTKKSSSLLNYKSSLKNKQDDFIMEERVPGLISFIT